MNNTEFYDGNYFAASRTDSGNILITTYTDDRDELIIFSKDHLQYIDKLIEELQEIKELAGDIGHE